MSALRKGDLVMARPRRDSIKRGGRPEKPIDWKIVDELLMAGCNGSQIAGEFDMHAETFYVKCQQEHNIGFTGYSLSKMQQGEARLKHKQYTQALKGNTQLLMFLGKVRLNQKEASESSVTEESLKAFNHACNHIENLRKARDTKSEDSSSQ